MSCIYRKGNVYCIHYVNSVTAKNLKFCVCGWCFNNKTSDIIKQYMKAVRQDIRLYAHLR